MDDREAGLATAASAGSKTSDNAAGGNFSETEPGGCLAEMYSDWLLL